MYKRKWHVEDWVDAGTRIGVKYLKEEKNDSYF